MRRLVVVIAGLLGVAACGSSGDTGSVDDVADLQPAIPADTSGEDVPAAIDADVAIQPGALGEGQLEVDGETVRYVTITPDGFSPGDTAPVLLTFPPGGQAFALTRSHVSDVFLPEAPGRGWVVVSPAAPEGGPLWFNGSEALVPPIMDWIETWVEPEGGSVHVAGVSNGGLSAFAVAALVSDRVQSVLVYPGCPRGVARESLSELTDVPVRMFVGETDSGFRDPMATTFDELTELGGDVTLDVADGEGHVIRSLDGGEKIFDELDANRSG